MKFALVAALAGLAVALSAVPQAHASSTSVTFQPPTVSVNPGESFKLDVVVTSDTSARALQFGLRYDPSVVQIDKVTDGTYFQTWARGIGAQAITAVPFRPDNANGTLSVGGISILGGPAGSTGPTGSGPGCPPHCSTDQKSEPRWRRV
jgi:hypothetical protein